MNRIPHNLIGIYSILPNSLMQEWHWSPSKVVIGQSFLEIDNKFECGRFTSFEITHAELRSANKVISHERLLCFRFLRRGACLDNWAPMFVVNYHPAHISWRVSMSINRKIGNFPVSIYTLLRDGIPPQYARENGRRSQGIARSLKQESGDFISFNVAR